MWPMDGKSSDRTSKFKAENFIKKAEELKDFSIGEEAVELLITMDLTDEQRNKLYDVLAEF